MLAPLGLNSVTRKNEPAEGSRVFLPSPSGYSAERKCSRIAAQER